MSEKYLTSKTIEKLIDSHRDTRTHLCTTLLVTISGTLTLMYHLDNNLNKTFFLIGLVASIILLFLYFEESRIINVLTRKLLEAENE